MKTFTYVIAPEGCQSYLTPGKKYIVIGDISYISRNLGFFFHCASEINVNCHTTSKGAAHLNGKDWIIPEIGQWPDGWRSQQSIECLRKAGALISIESYLQEPNKGGWNFMAPADSDYQGRTQQQVEGSEKIFVLCLLAMLALITAFVLYEGFFVSL